jgi:peptidoglycan/LPS O-acetylase OafA/YrhL
VTAVRERTASRPARETSAAPTSARTTTRPRRLNGLTPLRYFAAVAVVLVHVVHAFAHGPSLTTAAGYGYIGVTFFYMLSGFVLTWSFTGQSATRFWWGRIARIWPMALVLMAVAFTLLASQEKIPGTLGHVEDFLLLQAWDPRQIVYFGGNGVSWSLSCEMFFYLLFPAAIVLVRRLRRRGLIVASVTTVSVMLVAPVIAGLPDPLTRGGLVSRQTYYWLFYVFPPYRFGEFLIGMLLARAALLGLRVRRPGRAGLIAAAGLGGLVAVVTDVTLHTGTQLARPLVDLASVPPFALLLLAATTSEVRKGHVPLGARLPVLLGEWSFALFLVHKPLFLLTQRWQLWANTGGLAGLGMFLAYLCLATTVAAAVHYLLEVPAERALRKAPDWWRRVAARSTSRQPVAQRS